MKKIMFNDRYGLTDAVLRGGKTMTRRLVPAKYQQALTNAYRNNHFGYDIDYDRLRWYSQSKELEISIPLPFFEGEEVAVAQNYKDAGLPPDMLQTTYRPDLGGWIDLPLSKHHGWTNKLFVLPGLMPHQIRITGIRVERLQDISDEDCLREGVYEDSADGYPICGFRHCERFWSTPREAFAALIDKVSGKGTWDSNPWVWVYKFELVK